MVSNSQTQSHFSTNPMIEDQHGTMSYDFRQLQVKLGHNFANLGLLDLALTHSSVVGSSGTCHRSNQRLEFLGDRVLGLAIADMLYKTFSDEDEGSMARRHAALVKREALAVVARNLGLEDHVRMSRGEDDAGGRRNLGLLSDTCEAIIAAIYLDAGLAAAANFIFRNWHPILEGQTAPPIDAKTELQEWAQGKGLALPEYREIGRKGPPHAPVFLVEVSVQDIPPVRASGPSKRVAEKAAADAMLARVRAEHSG